MERVCAVRLAVHDLGHGSALYGDDDGGKCAGRETCRQARLTVMMNVALVGTALFRGCIYDRDAPSPAAPDPDYRVYEPSLRRHAVLCDQSVRPLCEWKVVLSTGAVLFLGVLLFDEFHLDRGAHLYEIFTLALQQID